MYLLHDTSQLKMMEYFFGEKVDVFLIIDRITHSRKIMHLIASVCLSVCVYSPVRTVWPTTVIFKVSGQTVRTGKHTQTNGRMDATKCIITLLVDNNWSLRKKVEPKQLHPWGRFMVCTSAQLKMAPPSKALCVSRMAWFYKMFPEWSCICSTFW